MAPKPKNRIIIVGGPNGAGKTTFALQFLPREADCPTFVNADLIADGLSSFDPARAAFRSGRLMLQLIAEHRSSTSGSSMTTPVRTRCC